jgi:hypothetical protein
MTLEDALGANIGGHARHKSWLQGHTVRKTYDGGLLLFIGAFRQGHFSPQPEELASNEWVGVEFPKRPNSGQYRINGSSGLISTSGRENGELSVSYSRHRDPLLSSIVDPICAGSGNWMGTHWLVRAELAAEVIHQLESIAQRER